MTQNKEAERKPIDPKDVNQFVNGLNDYRDNWMAEIHSKDYLTPNRKIEGNKKVKKNKKIVRKFYKKLRSF
ncbi:hypothetical protein [Lactococcus lactis]|uniref:hypothetical protein n=1 Tax=Lactococcus lactis TaxID=1358 RepID=UPI000A9D8146|nr:hypothetical protein [Lactococcus lactis]